MTKRLTLDNISFEVTPEISDIPIKGNALDSGDSKFDREWEEALQQRLDNGDIWAWCTVVVKGTYKSLTATDYLGGCSYQNEENFKQPGGYYDDMKQTVLSDLQEQLDDLCNC